MRCTLCTVLAAAFMAGPAMAVPPGVQPPAPVAALGSGAPAAGSGVAGQLYVDGAGHAEWLNVVGVWKQLGIFSAPTASDIGPPGSASYLATTGGAFILISGGGKIILQ